MSIIDKVDQYWSDREKLNKEEKNLKLRWWQSPHIISNINKRVCGESVSGASQGLNHYIKIKYKDKIPFKNGISVGCGTGKKEMLLIKQGLVNHFDLFELSTHRIEEGIKLAENMGLASKVSFKKGNAFELVKRDQQYDFVHWNNALHHMMNVDNAIAWSHKILLKDGLFYLDDYVGPNRLQWTDKMLEIATRLRETLPKKFLINPKDTTKMVNLKLSRPNIEKLIEQDPSEAVDSENIINSVKKYFPNAYIKLTGGVIYHLAMSNILHNFEEKEDKEIMDILMLLDDMCTEIGETHYAVAVAVKN